MSDQATILDPTVVHQPAPSRPALLALALAPTLVLVASLVQASPAAHDTASELASIAAAPLRYQVSAAIGFCATLLFVPGLLALAAPVRRTRPVLGAVGLGLSLTGPDPIRETSASRPVRDRPSPTAPSTGRVRRTGAARASRPGTNSRVAQKPIAAETW